MCALHDLSERMCVSLSEMVMTCDMPLGDVTFAMFFNLNNSEVTRHFQKTGVPLRDS